MQLANSDPEQVSITSSEALGSVSVIKRLDGHSQQLLVYNFPRGEI